MPDDSGSGVSRRQVLAASGTGLLAATAAEMGAVPARAASRGPGAGTPEQIHLTWGDDPARSVVVSWASPGQAVRPRVRIGERVIPAEEGSYTDGLSGEITWTYHARVPGLRPGATYGYAVTADNDGNAADPFSATFTTAPEGRAAFRFTSFGDLATPNTSWAGSYGQAAYAVGAVEQFQPLFHLLNGDLCYADLNPAAQPQVWRDFGNNTQASAAYRPWMPVPGNHEIEFGNGPQGFTSYLTRYTLPANGTGAFEGRWYFFRVGSVLFVSLSADDVVYQDAGAFVAGPSALVPAQSTGNPPIPAGTSLYVRGYSGGAQTRWLEATLAAARGDASIDWIVAQLHQCACSSSRTGNGSDLGIREQWLPLFDRYEVDLVLCGHDHDYERSFPVRGYDAGAGTGTGTATGAPVDTRRPHPVTTVDSGVFDTTQGTVHLILGCGGTSDNLDSYGAGASGRLPKAKVFTRPDRPVPSATPGVYTRPGADAVEDATWSARRDTATGYGIAVFDVNPGTEAGGQTSITVTHYHAVGADPVNPATGERGSPTGDYTVFETFTLIRPRSDGRRWHARQSASAVTGLTVLSRTGPWWLRRCALLAVISVDAPGLPVPSAIPERSRRHRAQVHGTN
jgi:Purple acid Phosphatase, N-terminal domain/Calcineurin-like phosphoesterase